MTPAAVGQPTSPQPGQPPAYDGTIKSVSNAPVPTGESKRPIALTLWVLTITESQGPEAGELEGALQDNATNRPALVGTHKVVRDMIAKLRVAGLLQKSREMRLVTLDGQTASAQTGADQPVIQATSSSNAGSINSIHYRSTGTIVQAKPVIDRDGFVQVGLNFDSSFFEISDGVVIAELAGKDPILAPVIARNSVTTLARIESGSAVLVSSDAKHDATSEKKSGRVELVILGAEIVAKE